VRCAVLAAEWWLGGRCAWEPRPLPCRADQSDGHAAGVRPMVALEVSPRLVVDPAVSQRSVDFGATAADAIPWSAGLRAEWLMEVPLTLARPWVRSA